MKFCKIMPSPMRFKPYPVRFALGASFLLLSFVIFHFMARFHGTLPLRSGVDPLFFILPIKDWTMLLTWGWLAFHVLAVLSWLRWEREQLPFILGTIGLFMIVRNVFITFTPVGIPEGIIPLYTQPALSAMRDILIFDHELFFSGHTGTPFLYFLLSRGPRPWRGFLLGFSILMAIGVLLTRNHYTIDVLGAYFITYAIYRLSRSLLLGLKGPPPTRVMSPAQEVGRAAGV